MSIGQALTSAMSGLRAAQSGLGIVSQNVANADRPGYTRKIQSNDTRVLGDTVVGVRTAGAQRTLDTLLQRTLRQEVAGAAHTDMTARYTARLDALYGPPGSSTAITSVYENFVNSLQQLTTSPESGLARSRVLADSNLLADRVTGLSNDIQGLRLETEQGLSDAVARINDALTRLEAVDQQVMSVSGARVENVGLLDERDRAIDALAGLMDIRVDRNADNSISVFTRSGVLLYDRQKVELTFDPRASMGPLALYDSDPADRGVGTIMLRTPNGMSIDLIEQGAFRSGEVAALIELRDTVLVGAQSQLDEFADGMLRALSRRDTPPVANFTAPANIALASREAAIGPVPNGLAVALPPLGAGVDDVRPGDRIEVRIEVGGVPRTVTVIRMDEAAATGTRLQDAMTAAPGDVVLGVRYGTGPADFAANIQAAFAAEPAIGAGFNATFAGGPPRLLSITGDGTPARRVTGLAAELTEGRTQGGSAALALFVDGGRGGQVYTGALGEPPQKRGISGRLQVNPSLTSDPSALVQMSPTTPTGDPTRPTALLDRLTNVSRAFAPSPGLGTERAPANATVSGFLQRIVTTQGQQAETASRIHEGQQVVVAGLKERYDVSTKVNVDEEMARLIELQQTYQASARIITAVDTMIQTLLRT
jgi:flagellar hook-associated protein 1 FlgK